jgi:hypothetical protein
MFEFFLVSFRTFSPNGNFFRSVNSLSVRTNSSCLGCNMKYQYLFQAGDIEKTNLARGMEELMVMGRKGSCMDCKALIFDGVRKQAIAPIYPHYLVKWDISQQPRIIQQIELPYDFEPVLSIVLFPDYDVDAVVNTLKFDYTSSQAVVATKQGIKVVAIA